MYFSLYTGTTYTVSSGNCPSFSCATNSSILMFTAGPRGQFPRRRRSRKRLSVCTMHGASFLNRARKSRCTVITDLDTSKRSTQKAFSCCDAILETGPAVSMRSELLVAHEKLGQLPLLTVYVVPV